MNVFDIIGPVMIGPSSSHTAGAVRLGRLAWKILGEKAVRADIQLSGSFAQTYRGHGTDKALIDDAIANVVATAGQDGGLIIATDHSFHEGMPQENVLYFLDKARELGRF